MPEIAFRMLISLTLKDPVNIESVVFCDPKNIMRGGVCRLRGAPSVSPPGKGGLSGESG